MKPYIVVKRNIELFHNLNSSPLDCDQTNSCHTQIDAWCGGFRWNLECDSSQNLVTLNYVISGSPKPSINYKLMWRVREWTFSARELTLWIICHFLWTDIHCQAWPVLSWDYLHVYPQIVFPRKLLKEKKKWQNPNTWAKSENDHRERIFVADSNFIISNFCWAEIFLYMGRMTESWPSKLESWIWFELDKTWNYFSLLDPYLRVEVR